MKNIKSFIKYNIVIASITLPVLLFAQNSNELLLQEFSNDSTLQAQNAQNLINDSAPTLDDSDVKLFIDKIEVVGQLEKPQAMFILPGSTPDIDDIQIEHSFFKEIFRTVEKRGRIQTKITTDPTVDRKDYIPW